LEAPCKWALVFIHSKILLLLLNHSVLPPSDTPAAEHQQLPAVHCSQPSGCTLLPTGHSQKLNVLSQPLDSAQRRESSSVNPAFLPLQAHYPAISALPASFQPTWHTPSTLRLSHPHPQPSAHT